MGIKTKEMQLLELLFLHVDSAIQRTNLSDKAWAQKGNEAARVIVFTRR